MPIFQFKTILAMALVFLLSLAVYVCHSISGLYHGDAKAESEKLVRYASRVLSRYRASPAEFLQAQLPSGIPLGGQRYHVVFSYDALQKKFPELPAKKSIQRNQVLAFGFEFISILKVPSYILILPIGLTDDETVYAYKIVYRDDGTTPVNLRVLEVIQPALIIALMFISSLVLVGMHHISRVHAGVRLFEEWAKKIKSGATVAPPIFPSSKLNYIAFAINNSVVNLSEALENEHNFASFTSHELRSSVTILSANLELLEYIKKDLSPQEKVLIKNMDSAILDMKHYMESFLWLGSEQTNRNLARFDAKDVVAKSLNENMSLFGNLKVKVSASLQSCEIFSEEPLFYVLVNNVLRNAFQHTSAGTIHVSLKDRRLEVRNLSEFGEQDGSNPGFGIGTKIVERLTDRLGVRCDIESFAGGRCVSLSLLDEILH